MTLDTRSLCRRVIKPVCGVLVAVAAAVTVVGQTPRIFASPKTGWLYLVASNPKTYTGQVLLVDPRAAKVMSSFKTGLDPDVVISARGDRLYMSYNQQKSPGSQLDVVDTSTGAVIGRSVDTLAWPSNGMAYMSRMALSRDESWLFRFKIRNAREGTSYFVQTFDTQTQTFLPETAAVPLCGVGTLLPGTERQKLYVLCADSQDVRLLSLTERGSAAASDAPRVPVRGDGIGGHLTAFVSPRSQTLTVIEGNGGVVRADAASGHLLEKDAIDRAARQVEVPPDGRRADSQRAGAMVNRADWLASRRIWRQPPIVSADAARLYMLSAAGTDTRADRDAVEVLNPETLQRLNTIRLSRPVVSISLSADGAELYAVDTLNGSVLVLSADTGRELRVIEGVGPRPIFGVVVP